MSIILTCFDCVDNYRTTCVEANQHSNSFPASSRRSGYPHIFTHEIVVETRLGAPVINRYEQG